MFSCESHLKLPSCNQGDLKVVWGLSCCSSRVWEISRVDVPVDQSTWFMLQHGADDGETHTRFMQ